MIDTKQKAEAWMRFEELQRQIQRQTKPTLAVGTVVRARAHYFENRGVPEGTLGVVVEESDRDTQEPVVTWFIADSRLQASLFQAIRHHDPEETMITTIGVGDVDVVGFFVEANQHENEMPTELIEPVKALLRSSFAEVDGYNALTGKGGYESLTAKEQARISSAQFGLLLKWLGPLD